MHADKQFRWLPVWPVVPLRRPGQRRCGQVHEVRVPRSVVTPQGKSPFQGQLAAASMPHAQKGGDHLAVTISVLTVLTVTVFVLCRYAGLRILHAAVCILLGFYLASSQFAPTIQKFVTSVIRLL
jgi:hypothetical protein